MVIILEAIPVGTKLLGAVLFDIRKPVPSPLLISPPPIRPMAMRRTYTDEAHLVTFLPSLRHSTSPFPPASCLQSMKSSL